MAGYTGTVRRGHSLSPKPGAALEEVTMPCPECGRLAGLEAYQSNGQTLGVLRCPSYRRGKISKFTTGCPPKKLSAQEMEILMAKKLPRLTEQQRKDLRALIASVGLTVNKANDLAGLPARKLHAVLCGNASISDEEIAALHAAVDRQKALLVEAGNVDLGPAAEDTVPALRKQMEDRFAALAIELSDRFGEHRNEIRAVGDLTESLFDRMGGTEEAFRAMRQGFDPRLTPTELASRIEHAYQELSRQGRALTEARNEIEDRITALAQALADREKDCDAEVLQATQALRRAGAAEIPVTVPTGLDPFLARPELHKDLHERFRGFEHLCHKFYKLCPHLFRAAVRRAAGVAQ